VNYVVVARHVVGVGIVALVLPTMLWGRFSFTDWLIVFFSLVVFAALSTGLVALFFTRTQAARSTKNFVLLMWAFTGLATLGTPYGQRLLSVVHKQQPAESAAVPREPANVVDDIVPSGKSDSFAHIPESPRPGYYDDTQKTGKPAGYFDDTQRAKSLR